jgi:hypothetical protein
MAEKLMGYQRVFVRFVFVLWILGHCDGVSYKFFKIFLLA